MNYLIKIMITIILLLDLSSCIQQKLVIKDVKNNVETSFLGIDFDKFLEQITYDEIQKVEGCCWGIRRQGELLIIIYDKQGLSDYKVRNIEILSPQIIFNDKIRIGMTVENLLKIYSNIELMIDENDYKTEYFSPPELFSYKADGSIDTAVVYEVESESGKPLSDDVNYPTKLFSKEGHISKISIFKWE
jgi:hypothetical protein